MFKNNFNIFLCKFPISVFRPFSSPLLAYIECHFLLDYNKLDFIVTDFLKQNLVLLFLFPSLLLYPPPAIFMTCDLWPSPAFLNTS